MPYGDGSPQLEDGFARIANEILDAISRTNLMDSESRCIHFLWRKTYGWHTKNNSQAKKTDIISYGQWAEGTGLERSNAIRTLSQLVQRNILTKEVKERPGKNSIILWGFQKKYKLWNGYHPLQYRLELVSNETLLTNKVVSNEPSLKDEVVSSETLLTNKVVSQGPKLVSSETLEVVSSETLEVVSSETPTIDNIDNIDNTTIDLPHKPLETNLLKILKGLNGWAFNLKEDLAWLRDFMGDYGGVEVTDFKACRDYFSGKLSPRNKGPWKNRLRNWMAVKARKSTPQKRAGKLPTTEELEIQAKEKGLL